MLKAAKFRFSFVEKQFVCELEWVWGWTGVCKRKTMELLFRAKFRIVGSSVHCTCTPPALAGLFNDAFSLPFLPAVATFRCCCFYFSLLLCCWRWCWYCCWSASFSILVFSLLFLVSTHKNFRNNSRSLVYQHTSKLQPPHLQCPWVHTPPCISERERERDTHKLTIKTKFSSQKYWLLDAEHTFNTSVQCCVVLCMNMLYYPKIGADNAT